MYSYRSSNVTYLGKSIWSHLLGMKLFVCRTQSDWVIEQQFLKSASSASGQASKKPFVPGQLVGALWLLCYGRGSILSYLYYMDEMWFFFSQSEMDEVNCKGNLLKNGMVHLCVHFLNLHMKGASFKSTRIVHFFPDIFPIISPGSERNLQGFPWST